MQIDPRLNDIDDSLYRVAVRALVMHNNKILAVKETDGGDWWAIPGGGVDYGEDLKACFLREIEEELGVPADLLKSNFQIVHYNIGKVVNGVPRMNVFFKAQIQEDDIKQTSHVEKWGWFTKEDFLSLDMNPSYEKAALVKVIFD